MQPTQSVSVVACFCRWCLVAFSERCAASFGRLKLVVSGHGLKPLSEESKNIGSPGRTGTYP